MQATAVRDASGRVIVALVAAGRSRATIKRYEAEFNAFAGFLEARGRAVPTEVDCLDFIAERSGSRLAGLRADQCPTGSARTPAVAPADGDLGWRRPGGGAGDNAAG
jgi:hypothetical protein